MFQVKWLTQIFFVYIFILVVIQSQNIVQCKPKAIVIGATSGMGRQVAKLLATDYEVGLCGRRIELLESLQTQIPTKTYIKQLDATKQPEALEQLSQLIEEMGGLDLIFISISGWDAPGTPLEKNKKLIEVDVNAFWHIAHFAADYFEHQGSGHLVGISSIDGLRGNALCPTYSAVKAFVARYLEGVRNNFIQKKIPVTVTDIVPGWVNNETNNFSTMSGTYWVSETQEAAQQIYDAIKAKKKKAYITKRWAIIAWLLDIMPDCLYNAIGGL